LTIPKSAIRAGLYTGPMTDMPSAPVCPPAAPIYSSRSILRNNLLPLSSIFTSSTSPPPPPPAPPSLPPHANRLSLAENEGDRTMDNSCTSRSLLPPPPAAALLGFLKKSVRVRWPTHACSKRVSASRRLREEAECLATRTSRVLISSSLCNVHDEYMCVCNVLRFNVRAHVRG